MANQQSTIYFMTENREMLVILTIQALICLIALVTLIAAIIALWIVMKLRVASTKSGKTFCGCCGEPVSDTPVSAVALTDQAFYVYRCDCCKNETLLSQNSLNRR